MKNSNSYHSYEQGGDVIELRNGEDVIERYIFDVQSSKVSEFEIPKGYYRIFCAAFNSRKSESDKYFRRINKKAR